MEKVSILIPAYNCENTIAETLDSCIAQDYPDLEIIVSDNCSTDKTLDIVERYPQVILWKGIVNLGGARNMERLLKIANGEYLVFMCSDDVFTCPQVISDIVVMFRAYPKVGYVGRYYYQFVDGCFTPVRGHRTDNPYFTADNPSGLAFRSSCLPLRVEDKTFIEAASIVKQVLDKGWDYKIIAYDTVAVRVGNNASQKPTAYGDSPLLLWYSLVGKQKFLLTSFVSLIQIANWAGYKKLLQEIWYFIKLKPSNIFRPDFWFFVLITLFTPRSILRELPKFYRHTIGRFITQEVKRA